MMHGQRNIKLQKEIETPVLLAHAIDDSTDIFGISGGGGLNPPNHPLGKPLPEGGPNMPPCRWHKTTLSDNHPATESLLELLQRFWAGPPLFGRGGGNFFTGARTRYRRSCLNKKLRNSL